MSKVPVALKYMFRDVKLGGTSKVVRFAKMSDLGKVEDKPKKVKKYRSPTKFKISSSSSH